MHAVTVISTRGSSEFNVISVVIRAGFRDSKLSSGPPSLQVRGTRVLPPLLDSGPGCKEGPMHQSPPSPLALGSSLTSLVVAFLMVARSTVKNTPAQDVAWSRWTTCRSQVPGVEIRNVQLDGRISFWANGAFQGRSMLDCLARARTSGPPLPEAPYATFPSGA